ncbi:MAG: Transposase [Firmicutes bacterium ADurb.Bin193]|nr:MAG: Transposase [Firmicutes bacterium ADurb.Bin193]
MKITGSVQSKNGRLYAVINYKGEDGKRKTKWINLNLAERGNKRLASQKLAVLLEEFEVEMAEACEDRQEKQRFYTYLQDWLKITQSTVQPTTINGYRDMVESRIKDFFDKPGITLESVTPQMINKFYASIFKDGCVSNTVIHYHAVLRKAFQYAVRNDIIPSNPCDKADKPKKNSFQGNFYSQEQLSKLLKACEDDPLHIVITLSAYYGLRRSEALGIRWSAIDFESKKISINHKVVEEKTDGKYIPKAYDQMKNKSSRRTIEFLIAFHHFALLLFCSSYFFTIRKIVS